MRSAADTLDDGTLLNASEQFHLNSMKRNIESCRYLEMSNPFPTSTQNKSLFLLHVNIRSIYKNLQKSIYKSEH